MPEPTVPASSRRLTFNDGSVFDRPPGQGKDSCGTCIFFARGHRPGVPQPYGVCQRTPPPTGLFIHTVRSDDGPIQHTVSTVESEDYQTGKVTQHVEVQPPKM